MRRRCRRSGASWFSGNYFTVLGLKPSLGRGFTMQEDGDQLGAYPVAVISYRLWKQRFHGDASAVGKILRVNRRNLTVVAEVRKSVHF